MKFIELKNGEEQALENSFGHDLSVFREDGVFFIRCNGKVSRPYDRIGIDSDGRKPIVYIKCLSGRRFKNYTLTPEGKLHFVDSTPCLDYDYYKPAFYYEHLLEQGYELFENNQDFIVFKTPKKNYFLAKYGDKILDVKKYPKFKSYIELALCYQDEYSLGLFGIKGKPKDEFPTINNIYTAFSDKAHKSYGDLFADIIRRERSLNKEASMQEIMQRFYHLELRFLFIINKMLKEELGKDIHDKRVKMNIKNCAVLNKDQFMDLTASEFARRKRYNGYITGRGVLPMQEAVRDIVNFMLKRMSLTATIFEFPDCDKKFLIDWMNLIVYSEEQLKENHLIYFLDENSFLNENHNLIKDAVRQERTKNSDFSYYDKLSISNLKLPDDIVRNLSVAGYYYVGDLIKLTAHELFIKGLSINQVDEVINTLAFWGLELSPSNYRIMNKSKLYY